MKKNEMKKLGLTEEQAESIIDTYKKAVKGSVPKSRLDEVIAERNALRIYIGEQDKKISMLEEETIQYNEQQKQMKQLQADSQKMKEKLEQAKGSLKLAIEMIL